MGRTLMAAMPIASHWARTEADWVVLLVPPFVLSAALAGRWLAERKRRRRRAVSGRLPPGEE